MFYSSVNNKWKEEFVVQILLSNTGIFPIRRKFSDSVKFSGGCLPRTTTPLWLLRGMFWPYNPKHRVPVQIPDGYPGPVYKNTRKSEHYIGAMRCWIMTCLHCCLMLSLGRRVWGTCWSSFSYKMDGTGGC